MKHNEIYDLLIKKIKQYHPSNDFNLIEKAYLLALEAHGSQVRKSGEPYIIHPLSVALILAELELDRETIVAGILHDVIEDTKYSYDDIVKMFSAEIADLVDGVTKLEKIKYTSREEVQAENYRKMFLAMAKDIRVILIKISDRLHNMRTLQHMSPEKQKIIAQETLDIYAPLADKLGISKVRYDLEDLSFMYLHEEAYFDLAEKIKRKQSERIEYVNEIVKDLRIKLSQSNIEGEVTGRPKHFFSIYKKMVNQNKTLDQIYDLFAVRVIVDDIRDCYGVLGIVHEMYKPIPGRFKDYIAMAKTNMYQSLHNTLIGPEGEPFEIQIRTWQMHRIAEYGIAAHWKYKQAQNGEVSTESEEEKLAWLRQILEWQRDLSDNGEYLKALKVDLDVFKDNVYCFTPKGQVISLTNGATPIDFAYAIHSAVGNKSVGARVNGKIVTFDYVLKNGDRVEIITSQNSKGPSRDWLKIVKTNQAKSKINQWYKKENRNENILRGKEALEKEAKRKSLVYSELIAGNRSKIVLKKYVYLDWESLCAAIGHGAVKETQVINRLEEEYKKDNFVQPTAEELIAKDEIKQFNKPKSTKKSGINIKGVGEIDVRFSKCCSPVPGDEIVGFITRGRGVSVHRTDCVNIINLEELERSRLIEAEWELPDKGLIGTTYHADLRIICDDRINLFMDISRVFTEDKIPIKSINARTIKEEAIFNIGIEITSKTQLDNLYKKLLNLKGIQNIERVTT